MVSVNIQNKTTTVDASPHLVWVFTDNLADVLGAATYLETTRELRQLGWRVTLISPGQNGMQQIRGVDVLGFTEPKVYFFRQLIFHGKLFRFLLRRLNDIDIVLFHEMSAIWFLPVYLFLRLRRKHRPLLVMDTRTVHMMPSEQEDLKDHLRAIYLNQIEQLVNYWVDGRLTITQRMAELLHIPADKLWGIWPSGVNPDKYAPARTERRWPEGDQPVEAIYIGCLHHERNLMSLSRAVMLANADGMAFRLTLLGDGVERAELERFAAQSNGAIRVLPTVPHDEIPHALAQAHLGVLPFMNEPKFQVSSPIKLFEYMAAGLPVLATRIVCHTDVLQDADYAFWADDGDDDALLEALREVWDNRARLADLSAQTAAGVTEWTWRSSAYKVKTALEYGMAKSATT